MSAMHAHLMDIFAVVQVLMSLLPGNTNPSGDDVICRDIRRMVGLATSEDKPTTPHL